MRWFVSKSRFRIITLIDFVINLAINVQWINQSPTRFHVNDKWTENIIISEIIKCERFLLSLVERHWQYSHTDFHCLSFFSPSCRSSNCSLIEQRQQLLSAEQVSIKINGILLRCSERISAQFEAVTRAISNFISDYSRLRNLANSTSIVVVRREWISRGDDAIGDLFIHFYEFTIVILACRLFDI